MDYETVIPSYIEVLAGLLIFGITLPTLLINIPPRLKAIRDKHAYIDLAPFHIDKRLEYSLIFQPRLAVAVVVTSILFLAGYLVPLPSGKIALALQPLLTWFQDHASGIIYFILGLNVIITAVFMWVLSSYTKEKLLRDLDGKCCRQAKTNNGRISPELLKSLGDLGAFCDAGHDKESVLHILDGLSNIDELHIDSRLEIARSVQNTIVDGNEQNYITAINLLQGIFRTAKDNARSQENERDYQNLRLADILRTLENVIIQAYVLRNPRVTASIMACYDEISMQEPNDYARAFLRIGRSALALKEEHHAGHGLDKLNTRITELISLDRWEQEKYKEAIQTYMGLLAHFWHLGNTARQHALKYLDELQGVYHWQSSFIDQQIIAARHAFEGIDLITADYLEQMLFEFRQLQYTRDFLLAINGINSERCGRILVHYPSVTHLRRADEEGLVACGIPKLLVNVILTRSNGTSNAAV